MDKGKPKDAHYDKRVEIAIKAYKNGCFVFSIKSQKLYTPREYVESGEEVSYSVGFDQYPDVTLLYPKKAFEAAHEKVVKAKHELMQSEINLQNVLQKIFVNYDLKPIERK
nr:hypothetical protein [Pedobacter sp. ASV19]